MHQGALIAGRLTPILAHEEKAPLLTESNQG